MTVHAIPLSAFALITDGVMGGVSRGTLARETVQGREAIRMRGSVSLDNNGGFIQMAADLSTDGSLVDASGFSGIELTTLGNGETYNLHVRTREITRPWQSYRQSFIAGPAWETHRIAFTDFAPHRIETPLDVSGLTRVGILGIGRVFEVDISMADIRLY